MEREISKVLARLPTFDCSSSCQDARLPGCKRLAVRLPGCNV